MPNLALPVREPGSLSDDVTSVWRLRVTGITGRTEFGYHADNVGMFLVPAATVTERADGPITPPLVIPAHFRHIQPKHTWT
jgi:hypothetical protein